MYKKSIKQFLKDLKAVITGFIISATITNIVNITLSTIKAMNQFMEQLREDIILISLDALIEDSL